MLSNPDKVKIWDKKQWHRHLQKELIYLPDVRTYSLQVKLLCDIRLLDLIDPHWEYCANDQNVQRFRDRAFFMRHRIKTAFDLTVTEKTDAIALLGRLFERVGLELHITKRVGPRGQQARYYGITQRSFNDPDRLAVLDALTRKYANLTEEFGSQRSASCNNTREVVATENGSQKSAIYINPEQVLATKAVPVSEKTITPTTVSQPSLPARAVEILAHSGEWLRGYFFVGRKGDRCQLADRTGFKGIFVANDEFRFATG